MSAERTIAKEPRLAPVARLTPPALTTDTAPTPTGASAAVTRTLRVAVIVPAYNEEECLAKVVETLAPLRECSEFVTDVIIVNDGSTDTTGSIARLLEQDDPHVVLLDLPCNGGIGTAMQTGFLYASRHDYDFALQFDGDGQHRGDRVIELIRGAREANLDLCIGSRFLCLARGEDCFRSTLLRRLGILFFAKLISILTSCRVTDPTSGFRVYSRRAIRTFARSYPDDYPEPEALFWCARNRLRVGELSTRMNERQGGVTSIRYLRTAYYMVKVTTAILIDFLRKREWSDQ